ncbi:hypothetical protein LY28_01728 [Ruminiclostridium sufflavum DSM 19573]|uniref:Uncharacterized protein n=1 Tax=Ruminiclostridium sufflavum DSM 19573 TaxID=1121337 RepID=A0A318XMU5_9FIRM|nr:hypothetical protein [Ruminiclostridium sufflavum]PYG88018.1 hypothetical protein LY28_01728 [Ruminiclostridium sufflavum DSM 19573]
MKFLILLLNNNSGFEGKMNNGIDLDMYVNAFEETGGKVLFKYTCSSNAGNILIAESNSVKTTSRELLSDEEKEMSKAEVYPLLDFEVDAKEKGELIEKFLYSIIYTFIPLTLSIEAEDRTKTALLADISEMLVKLKSYSIKPVNGDSV